MLECIRHRAKSTEEINAKLYGGQNNRQTNKNQKETPKTEKEKKGFKKSISHCC